MDLIKLISLDLDGTLLDNHRSIPERNRVAIQKAEEKGVVFIISTGSPYGLMPHDELEGLNISYAITANGSAIYEYKTRNCIYEDCIAAEMVLPVLEFLLTKDMHIDLFIGGKAYCPAYTRKIVDKLNVPVSRKNYILNNRVWLEDPITYIKDNRSSVQKITMNFYPDQTGKLVDRDDVKEKLEAYDTLHLVSGGWGNLEITKSGVNKGKALKRLCELENILMEETMAVGDSLNDLDIIKVAGIGVAMENGMEEVKRAADYITGTNDTCGVAEIIDKFFYGK